MRTFRNVFRRKLRAFLTIFGITIGVFALVVMGSMAEKITLLVDGGTRFYSDKVTVSQGSTAGFSISPLSTDKIPEIESFDGVKIASADITMQLDKEQAATFGVPDLIVGSDLRGRDLESFKVHYAEGRPLQPGDSGKATIGSDLVRKLNAHLGDTITVRDRQFELIGIVDKTFTIPDNTVDIPFADAQDIFYNDLPDLVKANLKPRQLASGFTIYPQPGVDPNRLAVEIQDRMPGYDAIGPAKFQEQVTNTTRIFTTIVFGVALISLLVGGLSVINTMTMSVFERTREVGIRKSLGASDGRIIRQFLSESAFIGAVGGLSGLFFGWLFVLAANAAGEASGTQIFQLTNRLALGSVLFAVVLGVLSGLYPSWHAARMNPVKALRYE
ncbi:MAG: FtsX-like permease family protein [Actinobacteria bacterium]|nr:FtsX-like permease family protein [Actinomycetota bacterium]MCL5882787.1 FtsX-like permease family protein [Actinomycetota bacterium]